MKVEQVMTKDVATCYPDDALIDAASLMAAENRGSLVVLAGDGSRRVAGILTDRDVCLAVARSPELSGLQVRSAMASPVHCCRPDDALWELVALAETHAVRRFPVVDGGGQLEGLITLDDIAREAARSGAGMPALSAHQVCRAIGRCASEPHDAGHLQLGS